MIIFAPFENIPSIVVTALLFDVFFFLSPSLDGWKIDLGLAFLKDNIFEREKVTLKTIEEISSRILEKRSLLAGKKGRKDDNLLGNIVTGLALVLFGGENERERERETVECRAG